MAWFFHKLIKVKTEQRKVPLITPPLPSQQFSLALIWCQTRKKSNSLMGSKSKDTSRQGRQERSITAMYPHIDLPLVQRASSNKVGKKCENTAIFSVDVLWKVPGTRCRLHDCPLPSRLSPCWCGMTGNVRVAYFRFRLSVLTGQWKLTSCQDTMICCDDLL